MKGQMPTTARIRVRANKQVEMTLVCPRTGTHLLLETTPFRQTLLVVRGRHLRQLEKKLRYSFDRGLLVQTTQSAIDGDATELTIIDTLERTGRTIRRTRTTIEAQGELRWAARDGDGDLLDSGEIVNGSGWAHTGQGGRIEVVSNSDWTSATEPLEGGGLREFYERQNDNAHQQKWRTFDDKGNIIEKGQMVRDTSTGQWHYRDEAQTPGGGARVSEASGNEQGGERHTTFYDAAGNVVGQEDAVEIINGDGSSSSTTMTSDAVGNTTFTSVTRDADGTVHTKVMTIDANGRIIRDESSDQTSNDDSEKGDDERDDDDKDDGEGGDDDEGGDDGEGGDDDEGDDDGGDGGGDDDGASASDDSGQGDGEGTGRGPLTGTIGGPRYPEGLLGRILAEFGSLANDEDGEWAEGNGPAITAASAARLIAAAHSAPPAGSGGDQRDGIGNGRPDITFVVPRGIDIKSWEDHPRPETIAGLVESLRAVAYAAQSSADALVDVHQASPP
jgi:hypothetical protein